MIKKLIMKLIMRYNHWRCDGIYVRTISVYSSMRESYLQLQTGYAFKAESPKAKEARSRLVANRKGMKFSAQVRLNMSKSRRKCSVVALTIDGNYHAEYESIKAAGKALNIYNPNITKVLSGKGNHIHGYIFVKKEDYDPSINYSKKLDSRSKPILQYKDGIVVGEYQSEHEACTDIQVTRSAIGKCIKGNWKCKGFNWKYKEEIICSMKK